MPRNTSSKYDSLRNYGVGVSGLGLTNKDVMQYQLIRDDLTAKGMGFFGNVNGSNVANSPAITELSIGVGVPKNYAHIPGLNPRVAPLLLDNQEKYFDAPSVIPGLSQEDIRNIQHEAITESIYKKALDNAINRQFQGKPVFKNSTEPVSRLSDR